MTPQQMQARLAARLSGPPDAASVERWRTEMTAADSGSSTRSPGMLVELGYPRA